RLEHDRDVQFAGGIAAWLRRELPKFLTRDGDRDLFDDLLKPQANEPSLGNIGNGSVAS
ncbi:mobilization protein, partial [Rhizobium ruizarguesonis]